MVQGYYTLEEAARILGVDTEELNQMAQRREVRAFADRGTWRFRTQDIEELARRRGLGSNPDLPLGEAPRPKPHDSPTPKKDSGAGQERAFKLNLDDVSEQVEIGQQIIPESGGAPKTAIKGSSKVAPAKSGPKSPAPSAPKSGPKSPAPKKTGSDSDVRLVAEGSDLEFRLSSDSDVKVVDDTPAAPITPPRAKPPSSSTVRGKPGPRTDSGAKLISDSDSDVRIVADSTEHLPAVGSKPMKRGSDSDVRLEGEGSDSGLIKKSSDSDVRLEGSSSGQLKRGSDSDVRLEESGHREKGAEDSFLTEEIDLDAELRKAEEMAKPKKPKSKPKAKDKPMATTEPFELSESDIDLGKPKAKQDDVESSSDFDLSLEASDESPIELSSSDLDLSKGAKEEEVALGELPARPAEGDSGISLQKPADSGISLEQASGSSEEIEFELSLDAESTPKPARAAPNVDSSSEFELTLEDSAGLAPMEEESSPVESKEKDIFETDFEVPALEDSGSEAVALDESDTDLESSDFDLALGEEDVASEEESGSQVVALEDEGEVDEGAATVARPSRSKTGAVAEEEAEGLVGGEEVVEEEEEAVPGRRVAVVAAAPADWGVIWPSVLLVCTILMFVVGLMSFELLHGMWGYRQPHKASGVVVNTITRMFYDAKEFPSD
jgi:excisionase family DNA binding protein